MVDSLSYLDNLLTKTIRLFALDFFLELIIRPCSIGINRFNRNRFRLKRLTFSNGILFQPFLVETW